MARQLTLLGDAPQPRKRSAAQVAAYQQWAPMTAPAKVTVLVEPELVGATFIHPKPLWVLQYRQTLIGQDGQRFILGTLVDQGEGTRVALGSEWSCIEGRLRRVAVDA